MKNNSEQAWIEAGYEIFAKEGPNGLKVEHIAKKVGISKSSFYHLFIDMELFQEKLLQYHLKNAAEMQQLAMDAKNIDPEMIQILVGKKKELLFHRQLCIHRDNKTYQTYFDKAQSVVVEAFFQQWVTLLGLESQKHIAKTILKVYTDNFFLRITEENLNIAWVRSLIQEIKLLVNDVRK
ncbi:MAG: TetR/AcrR family transcriptional regulator [Chitinophagales bacterium]|nr:TetR/AcrR family transcriptional regulator [Chitinophagales bacterium]